MLKLFFVILILSTQQVVGSDVIFEFGFDNLTTAFEFNDYAIIVGQPFLAILDKWSYQPFDDNPNKILLTDFTSITGLASNDESCLIPFDFDDVENYFCVENPLDEDVAQCQTSNGFADCMMGRFLIVRPFKGLNQFNSNFQFEQPLELDESGYYEVAFYYLINYFGSDPESTNLKTILNDVSSFSEIIFDSSLEAVSSNVKWTSLRRCFRVPRNSYSLSFIAINSYDADKIFVAIDEIVVRKLDENDDKSQCKSFLVEIPETSLHTTLPTESSIESTDSLPSHISTTQEIFSPTEQETTFSTAQEITISTGQETTISRGQMTTFSSIYLTSIDSTNLNSNEPTKFTSNNELDSTTSTHLSPSEITSGVIPTTTTTTVARSTSQTLTTGATTRTTDLDTTSETIQIPVSYVSAFLIIVLSVVSVIAFGGVALFGYFIYLRFLKSTKINPNDVDYFQTTNV